jgi:UDP-N-acetylglucosamine--N-acetylmuramyl-(pentapeptide) pyrophosphoryl-undecaprenol N-acetylglucosamine transferase
LRHHGVSAVVGTGGRTSVVVALAGRSLGLPLCLLEQNAVTGRANRLLARFARRLYLGLPIDSGQLPNALLTGTPLRPDFANTGREVARERLGLDPADRVVLVTGGSQGAEVLNERIPAALGSIDRSLVVHHLAGQGRVDAVRGRYADFPSVRAHVADVTVDMATLYAASDLVVCRGGGCTVAELIATGRPALIVPYPFHKDRQQLRNANVLQASGAARVVEQHELDHARLCTELRELLDAPDELRRMGAAARALAPPDPCTTIVQDLEEHVLN